MTDFVTCKVKELKDHPQASKLKVAVVFDGSTSFTVVCGAKNIQPEMITILAQPGSTTLKGMQIQESQIRGVTSQGMLCSPLELGISEEQGIVNLPPNTALGQSYKKLEPSLLSSTPWWSFKLVEQFFWDEKNQKIEINRDLAQPSTDSKRLISETYWSADTFFYRKI